MKLPKLNQSGIAHILAPLLFIVVFAGIGAYLLTHSKAAEVKAGGCSASTPVPTISPNEDTAFANKVDYVTIDVAVPKCKHALAVEFYRNGKWLGALATHSPATKANGYKNHFIEHWRISHANAGSYHWRAKIHTRKGLFFAVNNQGDRHTDLLVIGNASDYKDSKFLVPDNNAVWKSCVRSNVLRVEVIKHWSNSILDNPNYGEPPDPKGVQFINTSVNNPIHYEVTEHTYRSGLSATADSGIFYTYWLRKLHYDYTPAYSSCLPKGPYDWIARVINSQGTGAHLAQPHDDAGAYHLNLTVE